jgi:hypothetical protein
MYTPVHTPLCPNFPQSDVYFRGERASRLDEMAALGLPFGLSDQLSGPLIPQFGPSQRDDPSTAPCGTGGDSG